jgi:hypothetical protein
MTMAMSYGSLRRQDQSIIRMGPGGYHQVSFGSFSPRGVGRMASLAWRLVSAVQQLLTYANSNLTTPSAASEVHA